MASVKYSDAAIADLEQIGDYISDSLYNPQAALNTVRKIQNAIDMLENFPLIGAPLSSIADIDTDYRFLVSGNYLTFYRIEDEKVFIDRILYGKRDYMVLLFGDSAQTDTF